MNLDFTLNLQDLETLLTKSNCSCHFINPNKTRILLWKEIKDNQITYHLRIGIQKFTSQEQIDRNGDPYWKFEIPVNQPVSTAEVKPEIQTELDPITKFQQRQAQAKDYAKQSVNDSAVS